MNMRVRCPKTEKSFVVQRDQLEFTMNDSDCCFAGEVFVEFRCQQCDKVHKIEINQYQENKTVAVMKCNNECQHAYQDREYGKGRRVHNQCGKPTDSKFRCTVCDKETYRVVKDKGWV